MTRDGQGSLALNSTFKYPSSITGSLSSENFGGWIFGFVTSAAPEGLVVVRASMGIAFSLSSDRVRCLSKQRCRIE